MQTKLRTHAMTHLDSLVNQCAGDLVTASVHRRVLAALPSGLVND